MKANIDAIGFTDAGGLKISEKLTNSGLILTGLGFILLVIGNYLPSHSEEWFVQTDNKDNIQTAYNYLKQNVKK